MSRISRAIHAHDQGRSEAARVCGMRASDIGLTLLRTSRPLGTVACGVLVMVPVLDVLQR
jgi:hypothetical protein